MMNNDERFKYYIKNWNKKQVIKIPEQAKCFKQNELIYYSGPNTTPCKDFNFKYGIWNPMFWWNQPDFPLDIPCLTISADGIDNKNLPALVKVRQIDNPLGGIVCPFAYNRHWSNIKVVKNNDKLWNEKINNCIWRGTVTGIQDYNKDIINNSKNLRIIFVNKWYNKYDVGLIPLDESNKKKINNYLIKESIDIPSFLKYKYIISIPGNDKDSGLNWKLSSNSLVIMAKPKIESWLMEGLLEPYVHYVPLKDDYSDLDDIINWCIKNDEKCYQITINANNFMKQFDNYNNEKLIFDNIKKYYSDNIILKV